MIVNFCQWQNTARLVGQLLKSRCARREEAEVVIVDNHSPPHRLMHQLRCRPGVSLRRFGRNVGFARGVNEGCRLSRGQWLLLLNPDVTVEPEFLDRVLGLAQQLSSQETRAGIVGFKLHNRDGSRQLSSGFFPTLVGTLTRLLLPRARRKYHDVRAQSRRRVPWVTGCCLLVRRDCFEELAGLDEDYFLYYEDVDFCRRARARGWSVWYEPGLTATHHFPLHQRPVPTPLRFVTRHALLTYAERHWPSWQFGLVAWLVALESMGRQLWAQWRGDRHQAAVFEQLHAVCRDMILGKKKTARRRLHHLVRAEGANLTNVRDPF